MGTYLGYLLAAVLDIIQPFLSSYLHVYYYFTLESIYVFDWQLNMYYISELLEILGNISLECQKIEIKYIYDYID